MHSDLWFQPVSSHQAGCVLYCTEYKFFNPYALYTSYILYWSLQRYLQEHRVSRGSHIQKYIYIDNKYVTDDVSFVRRGGWAVVLGGGSFNHSALPSPPRYPTPYDNAYPNTNTGAMAAPSMESHNNALVSRPPGPEYQLSVGEGSSPQPPPPQKKTQNPPKPALARSPILGRKHITSYSFCRNWN